MKALILAAGFGTRMAHVIGDRPKALVEIGGRTILDHLFGDLTSLGVETTIVTNDLFKSQLIAWQARAEHRAALLNDGSTCAEDRLGAIGDLAFAIDRGALDDDLLVLAADNLLDFSLAPLLESFVASPQLHLAVWRNTDAEDQKRRGVVQVDGDQVISFTEKPASPPSDYAAAPIYVLPRHMLAEPGAYLRSGGNPDAPGYLMEYLVARFPARAWHVPGDVLDVGNPESYRRALTRYAPGVEEANRVRKR